MSGRADRVILCRTERGMISPVALRSQVSIARPPRIACAGEVNRTGSPLSATLPVGLQP